MTLIEPAPNAPVGSVSHLHEYTAADFPLTGAVLCRNNAPLVALAMDLLKRSVPCNILGRDLATGLSALAEKLAATSMFDFRTKLLDHCNKEVEKLCKKGKAQAAAAYSDKCEALRVISSGCTHPSEVKLKIELLFKNGDGVTLCTVHRSKGKEWETVFILDFDQLMPSPYAETDEELQQEHNLIYVAQTRAKLCLVYINSDCFVR